MTVLRSATWLILAPCMALTLSAAAEAAEVRFVASNGNDNGPCTRSAPCRTLQRGVNRTPDGGELIVVDSASYGNGLTIGKSITIAADGAAATLSGAGNIAIVNATAVVTLRGLLLKGTGTDVDGIAINSAAAVHIENCVVERFTNGIAMTVSADTELFISDTVSRDNGEDGLLVISGGTASKVTVENSRFENNGDEGIDLRGPESSIARTVASGNVGNGIEQGLGRANVTWTTVANNAFNGFATTGNARLTVEYSVSRGNASSGLIVNTGQTAIISNSVFTNNNVFGVRNNGGTLRTRGNNTISENTTNTSGTLTILNGL